MTLRRLLAALLALAATLALALPAAAVDEGDDDLLVSREKPQELADRLIDFEIKDQHDREHTDAELRDRVAVLMWIDRQAGQWRDAWHAALKTALQPQLDAGTADVRIVAHVKGAPFFIKGRIKGAFRDDVSDWVLMDWKGRFEQAYGPTADHVNVMVFAADGALAAAWTGQQLDEAVTGEVAAKVAELTAAP